jgi:glycosyltransferase involved in cell wall biosynthesis
MSGYAEAARQYCLALKRLGVDLITTSLDNRFFASFGWMAEACKQKKDGHFTVMHDIPALPQPGYYTTFEYNRAPDQWALPLRHAQVVMTPSEFSKNSLAAICDKEKIHVVHHGVSERFTPFGPSAELESDVELPTFKFLSVFEWVERKCGDRLVKAFQQAFGPDDDVGLFIKTAGSRKVPLVINKVPGCKIFMVDGFVNDMAQLYRAFDAYISCSSGEGWGETLSEAMACGLPVIGSRHGGNLEFMNDDNSFLVDVEPWQAIGYNMLEPLVAPWMLHRPPVVESMKIAMRAVMNDTCGAAKRNAMNARKVTKDFTWEKAAKRIIEIVEAIQK